MPKYGGKQNFSLGSFPKLGQKQQTQREEEERRAKVNDYNGQYLSPEAKQNEIEEEDEKFKLDRNGRTTSMGTPGQTKRHHLRMQRDIAVFQYLSFVNPSINNEFQRISLRCFLIGNPVMMIHATKIRFFYFIFDSHL